MAVGWAGDDAVNAQIKSSLEDEVSRARSRLPQGKSFDYCEICGEAIPKARQEALPGVRKCVECQKDADKNEEPVSPYNRKGSKDSQLR